MRRRWVMLPVEARSGAGRDGRRIERRNASRRVVLKRNNIRTINEKLRKREGQYQENKRGDAMEKRRGDLLSRHFAMKTRFSHINSTLLGL